MDYREYPFRYLHIAGAFALGGTSYHVEDVEAHVQMPAVAAAHLPLAGGRSEAKSGKTAINASNAKFGALPRAKLAQLKASELASIGSGHSLCESDAKVKGKPHTSRSMSEIRSLRIAGGLTLKHGLVKMELSHDTRKSAHPTIRFDAAEMTGLKLGKHQLKVTLDTAIFNKFATLADFEEAYRTDAKLRAKLSNRFLTDGDALHKTASGYLVGSIVKKIEGLPPDAQLLDAYTIFWAPVGRIVLGEVLMSPHLRRVTLVRVKESCTEAGSGCTGGGSLP